MSSGSKFIPKLSRRTGLTRGAFTAMSTIVPVGIAIGLLPPLLALTLSDRGVSERVIGYLVATMAIAVLFATPHAARIGRRYGIGNTIGTMVIAAAALIPVFWLFHAFAVLFALAFLYGCATSICFALSEYWINAATPTKRRGLVMGIYATLLSIGFAIGPGILVVLGTDSLRPFLAGSFILFLSAIPAIAGRRRAPEIKGQTSLKFLPFIFAVPAATLGALTFAAAESGGFAFLPLWGKHLGFPAFMLPLLASAMTLGNVVFQIPLGMLSDRVDRRFVLLALGIVGAIGMALAYAASASPLLVTIILFVWGGATAGIYTVGLAHLAGRFSGSDLAGATAAFIFCYALGMLLGPPLIGETMIHLPTAGLPLVMGSAFAAYALFMAIRINATRGRNA